MKEVLKLVNWFIWLRQQRLCSHWRSCVCNYDELIEFQQNEFNLYSWRDKKTKEWTGMTFWFIIFVNSVFGGNYDSFSKNKQKDFWTRTILVQTIFLKIWMVIELWDMSLEAHRLLPDDMPTPTIGVWRELKCLKTYFMNHTWAVFRKF